MYLVSESILLTMASSPEFPNEELLTLLHLGRGTPSFPQLYALVCSREDLPEEIEEFLDGVARDSAGPGQAHPTPVFISWMTRKERTIPEIEEIIGRNMSVPWLRATALRVDDPTGILLDRAIARNSPLALASVLTGAVTFNHPDNAWKAALALAEFNEGKRAQVIPKWGVDLLSKVITADRKSIRAAIEARDTTPPVIAEPALGVKLAEISRWAQGETDGDKIFARLSRKDSGSASTWRAACLNTHHKDQRIFKAALAYPKPSTLLLSTITLNETCDEETRLKAAELAYPVPSSPVHRMSWAWSDAPGAIMKLAPATKDPGRILKIAPAWGTYTALAQNPNMSSGDLLELVDLLPPRRTTLKVLLDIASHPSANREVIQQVKAALKGESQHSSARWTTAEDWEVGGKVINLIGKALEKKIPLSEAALTWPLDSLLRSLFNSGGIGYYTYQYPDIGVSTFPLWLTGALGDATVKAVKGLPKESAIALLSQLGQSDAPLEDVLAALQDVLMP